MYNITNKYHHHQHAEEEEKIGKRMKFNKYKLYFYIFNIKYVGLYHQV